MAVKFTPIFSFTIKGKSMEPFYEEGDKVLVNRLAYLLNDPRTGDVVVLQKKGEGIFIIKRIIEVKGKKYFVRGDNYEYSTDSRKFGWIEKKDIIGRVIG